MNLLPGIRPLRLERLRARARRAIHGNMGRNVLGLWVRIRRAVRPAGTRDDGDDPDAPFALVTAPVKPRLPRRSGAVAVDPYEY